MNERAATKSEPWPPHHGVPAKSRFKKARSLKWGETPFDNLTRGELLRLVQAYHSAITSARSVMAVEAERCPSVYWTLQGVGGRALAKANHLMKLSGNDDADPASEKIYRSFFRTADSLMFPYLREDRFHKWGVNSDGVMCAPFDPSEGYRPIKWKDVCPESG